MFPSESTPKSSRQHLRDDTPSSIASTTTTTGTTTYLIPDTQVLNELTHIDKNYCLSYEIVSIRGFEIYIVEQWATERRYSTVITSFTGDSEHEIKAAKLALPKDQRQWSNVLRSFFAEIESYGGKPKDTEQGILYITNLAKFPSNFNLLPVIGGCVADIWNSFKVNLNLRKLNCGGRSALLMCSPSDVAEDKFRLIYKTHPNVDIMYSVVELVMLVQICLVDCNLLDPLLVDGLFCKETERSISEWWNMYGTKYLGANSPKDGPMSPTTVAAILGFLLSCTFRLDNVGSDFPKEPFNYSSFGAAVGKFQKQYSLHRTLHLDPQTVDKLFKVTAKSPKADSALKKVVKYTVHDLPRRTNSLQCAHDVLSTDLDKVMKYFGCSARLQYLWFAKGKVKNIESFNYYPGYDSDRFSTSTFFSGVGMIKKLPKKLQDDNTTRKKHKLSANASTLTDTDEGHSEVDYEPQECVEIDKALAVCDENPQQCIDFHTCRFGYDEVLQQLGRRLSFPYINSEIGHNQLNYKNHAIAQESAIHHSLVCKRSKSFSFIEPTILKWDLAAPSPVYLAQQIKSMEKQVENSATLNHVTEFKPYRTKIHQKSQQVQRLTHQTTPFLHRFELQKQENERLRAKIQDIKSIGARLEYEIQVLQNKVRDVEESVDMFVRKVEALDTSVSEQLLQNGEESVTAAGRWGNRLWNNKRFQKYFGALEALSVVNIFRQYQVSSDKKTD